MMVNPSKIGTAVWVCLLTMLLSSYLRAQSKTARSDRADCGLHCLYAAIVAFQPGSVRISQLAEELGPPQSGGYSLLQLKEAAENHGLKTRGVKTSTGALRRRPDRFLCIAAVDGDHFVVVTNVERGIVTMIDGGNVIQTEEEVFSNHWSGEALLLSPDELIPEADIPPEWPQRWGVFVPLGVFASAVVAIFLYRKFKNR